MPAAMPADIFGSDGSTALTWAKAILTIHRAGFETEASLSKQGQYGEFVALNMGVHAHVLDAVHGLIDVAEALAFSEGAAS